MKYTYRSNLSSEIETALQSHPARQLQGKVHKQIKILTESYLVLEAYLEPNKTSKMELFVIIVNGLQPLTIFEKSFMLDV